MSRKLSRVVSFQGAFVLAVALSGGALAEEAVVRPVAPQFLLGFTSYDRDEMDFTEVRSSDGTQVARADVSDQPTVGLAAQMDLNENGPDFGIEAGALFSYRSDSGHVAANSASDQLSIDVEMAVVDMFFGLFINQELCDWVGVYGGAGPYAMLGRMSRETFEEMGPSYADLTSDETSNILGFGLYARAGVEFSVENGWLGVGGRLLTGDMDFSGDSEDMDVSALQGFLTYSMNW